MLCAVNFKTMERNFKSIQIKEKWGIEVEYYSTIHNDWRKRIVKDWNEENLLFIRKCDADEWIDVRKDIMKIHP